MFSRKYEKNLTRLKTRDSIIQTNFMEQCSKMKRKRAILQIQRDEIARIKHKSHVYVWKLISKSIYNNLSKYRLPIMMQVEQWWRRHWRTVWNILGISWSSPAAKEGLMIRSSCVYHIRGSSVDPLIKTLQIGWSWWQSCWSTSPDPSIWKCDVREFRTSRSKWVGATSCSNHICCRG